MRFWKSAVSLVVRSIGTWKARWRRCSVWALYRIGDLVFAGEHGASTPPVATFAGFSSALGCRHPLPRSPAHVLPDMQEKAAKVLEEALR